jgi:hypothetical protein
MIRDISRDQEYWNKFIFQNSTSLQERIYKIQNQLIPIDRIVAISPSISYAYLELLSGKYSSGADINGLISNWITGVQWISTTWSTSDLCKEGYPPKYYKFFNLDKYDEILWYLSLGILLKVESKEFCKLVEVIDKLEVKDFLLEFLIRKYLPSRTITYETYEKHFIIPKVFNTLRTAIQEQDKKIIQEKIKVFIRKEWLANHRSCFWSSSHKSSNLIYQGYWCYEAAAITCILDLDDSSYRDWKYYPKDIVDFYRSKTD